MDEKEFISVQISSLQAQKDALEAEICEIDRKIVLYKEILESNGDAKNKKEFSVVERRRGPMFPFGEQNDIFLKIIEENQPITSRGASRVAIEEYPEYCNGYSKDEVASVCSSGLSELYKKKSDLVRRVKQGMYYHYSLCVTEPVKVSSEESGFVDPVSVFLEMDGAE